jgi:hypothetical protein
MEQVVCAAGSICKDIWRKVKSVGGCLHTGREPRDSLLSEYVVSVKDAMMRRGSRRGRNPEKGCLSSVINNSFPFKENKKMKQCLEEELKSRKDLEKLVRKLLKQTDECIRSESSSKTSILQ